MNQDYQTTVYMQEFTATVIQKSAFCTYEHPRNLQESLGSMNGGNVSKRPKFQFPKSLEAKDSIICEYERVLKIYNRHHNDNRVKLTVTMKQWFLEEAERHGWGSAQFFKCDGTTKEACFLVKKVEQESIYAPKH